VFDIETIPQNEERLLAIAPEFKPAGNLKDPAKIADSIAEKRSRYLADAALDWKTAHVVLIGVHDGEEFIPLHGEEVDVLRNFFSLAHETIMEGCRIGGHNVKGFDLPMVINRARTYGLRIPESILDFWKGRPQWSENIFDTLEILTFGNKQDIGGNGVGDVAKALGLPAKLGHGSDFPALWKSDQAAAIKYCQRDTEIEIEIARACGLI
jgi:predicted PolB exonuclease-like 3'-5' exonuclease